MLIIKITCKNVIMKDVTAVNSKLDCHLKKGSSVLKSCYYCKQQF